MSDPSDLRPKSIQELDRCFSLLSLLGKRVERAGSLARTMPGNCKYCHGPTGTQHAGSKWGYVNCKLSHSSLCSGGVTGIPDTRMACPPGYVQGKVMDYPDDPRDDDSESTTEVSDQHFSQIESESEGPDQKKSDAEKLVAPLIALSLSLKSTSAATGASATSTSISWSNASLLSSAPKSSILASAPNLFIQQQLAEMKRQQLLQVEKDQERDNQLQVLKQQLEEAKQDAADVKRKSSRNVSFSTGASSGGELADQAAKLAARAQRKAKKKVNDVGVDMNMIRETPGLDSRVDEFMQSVNGIPSLSLGGGPAHNTPQPAHSAHQTDGASSTGLAGDSSVIATLMAQQQSMMSNQMKIFMDFQQQQAAASQQQQLQVQALLEKLHSSSSNSLGSQARASPSSAEKRAERNAREKQESDRRKSKLEAIKDDKKKCDDEYEAAVKKLELARRAKKKAEKLLAGATESDSSDVDDQRKSPNKTSRNLLTQFSSSPDSDSESV